MSVSRVPVKTKMRDAVADARWGKRDVGPQTSPGLRSFIIKPELARECARVKNYSGLSSDKTRAHA